MQKEKIMLELDEEIARLQKVRSLLDGTFSAVSTAPTPRKPGRPPGAGKLSLQGRKKIGDAMKRSWAERKKRAAAMARKA